ncbi:hypothetical protein EV421DRAFT_1929581 [Armillaria borealis]|uniref:Uncharacterized protein n=1 Tax=Armillaria borealis TaxID=47425 RepID=A0AA39MEW1_9AGAR|nr:hypothetical protein EV421DRAFT_1929581 [Armillaria borealis]
MAWGEARRIHTHTDEEVLHTVDEMLVHFQCLFAFGLLESVFEPERLLVSVDSEGKHAHSVASLVATLSTAVRRWAERVEEDLTSLVKLIYRLASFCASRLHLSGEGVRGGGGALRSCAPKKPSHSFPVSSFPPLIKDAVLVSPRHQVLPGVCGYLRALHPKPAFGIRLIPPPTPGSTACAYINPSISAAYDLLQRGGISVVQRFKDASQTPYITFGWTAEEVRPKQDYPRARSKSWSISAGHSLCIPKDKETRRQAIR